MEKCLLPLAAINSRAAVVVYSETKSLLLSEHETRAEALDSLSVHVKREPLTDAAVYEREDAWRCILRCPQWHEKWLEEATERLKKAAPFSERL